MGRFALRDDRTMFLFISRAEHSSADATPKEQLDNQFGDAGWECPRILAALKDVDDLYFDVVSQIRMDRWSRWRVLLIGDAAGCISLLGGEATGLAIIEAYVLAGELHCAEGDHQRAFIRDKQSSAEKFIGFFATKTRYGLWFRNLVMRTINFGPLANLFGGGVRDDFEPPEYAM